MTTWREETIGDARLILGDCREVLPTLSGVDAVICDPPYGIGFNYASYKDTRENLTDLIRDAITPAIALAKRAAITPGQTQVALYPLSAWICSVAWDTTGSFGACGYSQWMPVLFYGKDVRGFGRNESGSLKSDVIRFTGGAAVGFQRTGDAEHPCPKPENVMIALVSRFSEPRETVFDPFLGSGTTGVACAKLGRRFIGIEIEPKYYEIALRRIEQAYKQADLFIPGAPVHPVETQIADLFREPAE